MSVKKIRLAILILLAALLAAPLPVLAAYPTSSSPTPHYRRVNGNDHELVYYTISSAAQLRGLASLLSPEAPVYLTCDIYLNPDENPTEYPFAPIGGENKAFVGVFDGMGHTIHNLYISTSPTGTAQGSSGAYPVPSATSP